MTKQDKLLNEGKNSQPMISKERYMELIATLDTAVPRNEMERKTIKEMKKIRAEGKVIDTSIFD